MITPEQCQCDEPGFCPLMRRECDPPEGRQMGDARHDECKNKPHYFEMFLAETERPCRKRGRRRKKLDELPASLCAHRGMPIAERKGDLCGCKEPQTVYACRLHKECTIKRVMKDLPACNTCEDKVPIEFRKNLIMFVLPVTENGGWQANVDIIREHKDLFDGRRVACIAKNARGTIHRLDSPGLVKERFGSGFEFIEIENSKRMREVAGFHPLMEAIESVAIDEVTFFCHAKGCTHAINDGATPHRWRDAMYEVCLHWPSVNEVLQQYPICGCFKRYNRLGASNWHFSGTFYWFRNRDVFTRDWRAIDRKWFGTETWPCRQFKRDEAGCLMGDHAPDLYQMQSMPWMEKELEAWRERHSIPAS